MRERAGRGAFHSRVVHLPVHRRIHMRLVISTCRANRVTEPDTSTIIVAIYWFIYKYIFFPGKAEVAQTGGFNSTLVFPEKKGMKKKNGVGVLRSP